MEGLTCAWGWRVSEGDGEIKSDMVFFDDSFVVVRSRGGLVRVERGGGTGG